MKGKIIKNISNDYTVETHIFVNQEENLELII